MNYDEFSFFNQQLASMLRTGIPLEGALRQLSSGMRSGKLRAEVRSLEADLAQGTPIEVAMRQRKLPDLYRQMVKAGVQSNDLPGTLTLLADHYHRANLIWTRLKGLMLYPILVILVSLGLTLVVSLVFSHFVSSLFTQFQVPPMMVMMMWIPPAVLAALGMLALIAVAWSRSRERLRWRLPGFREASLAQLASGIALMLRSGTTLADSLTLAQQLEGSSPASGALAQWRSDIEAGRGKPVQWSAGQRPFPPLFLWLIQQGGEDVPAGFEKAAALYRDRANYRIELAMYGALPVSVMFLGLMVLWQLMPLIQTMTTMMKTLS